MTIGSAILLFLAVWREAISSMPELASDDLRDMVSALGPASAPLTFAAAAYLVGSLMQSSITSTIGALGRRHLDRFPRPEPKPTGLSRVFRPMSQNSKVRVYDWASNVSARANGRQEPNEADRELGERAIDNVLFVGTRLLVVSPELHGEVNRLRSGAELRDAVALTLPVFTVSLLLHLAIGIGYEVLIVCLVLLVSAALFFDARDHTRNANSIVAHSLADNTISSGVLDSVNRILRPSAENVE